MTSPRALCLLRSESDSRRLRLSPDRTDLLWLPNSPPPERLRDRGYRFTPTISPNPEDAVLWIRRWADEPIDGNRTIKDVLTVDELSFWWLVDVWMAGDPLFLEIFVMRAKVRAVLEVQRPTEIRLLSHHAVDDAVFRAEAAAAGIPYRWEISGVRRAWERVRLLLRPHVVWMLRLTQLVARGAIASLVRRRPSRRADILINATPASRDARTGEDRLNQATFDAARRRGLNPVTLHVGDSPHRIGLETLLGQPESLEAWERFVTPATLLRGFSLHRRIMCRWNAAAAHAGPRWPADPLLRIRAHLMIRHRVREGAIALCATRSAVRSLRPRAALVTEEYGVWGRCLVIACRESAVPIGAIQHGHMYAGHPGFTFLPGDLSPDGDGRSPYCPMPDWTAVYGEDSKNVLVRHGRYPADRIRVTGSTALEHARRRFRREEVRASLGIPAAASVLVYFGAPLRISPADDRHLRALCAAGRALPELQILLKPHPGEQDGEAKYRASCAGAPPNVRIVADRSPWALIAAADAAGIINSSAGYDAMAWERVSIRLNLGHEADVMEFVARAGCPCVTDERELVPTLERVLRADVRREIIERQNTFIRHVFAPTASPSDEILDALFERSREASRPTRNS